MRTRRSGKNGAAPGPGRRAALVHFFSGIFLVLVLLAGQTHTCIHGAAHDQAGHANPSVEDLCPLQNLPATEAALFITPPPPAFAALDAPSIGGFAGALNHIRPRARAPPLA
jgi:hypothetical protein